MPVIQVDLQQVLQRIKSSCLSFFKENFNTNSLISAIFLSLPIYFQIFNPSLILKALSFISVFLGFWVLLNKKTPLFGFGFFIGLFWFWWIGLSFRYYSLGWMIPVVVLLVATGYGLIFWMIQKLLLFFQKILNKFYEFDWYNLFLIITLVFFIDYIKPFTFDWLKFDILFLTFLPSISKWQFLFFLLGLWLGKKNKIFYLLVLSIFIQNYQKPKNTMNIYLATTYVPQNLKWQKSYIPKEIQNNFRIIQKAIKEKYKIVVLPESAFPLFLNLHPELIQKLKNLSNKITIITGALHYKNKKFYNSTYIFENGKMKILDKHVLVPFGEYIPLPFFQKEINRIFFGGASDYSTSDKFETYKIDGKNFINAICYEATLEDIYKLPPKNIIALTNDAWFMPSIEPLLQKLLIKYYASKYKKNVYHSINGYKSYKICKK